MSLPTPVPDPAVCSERSYLFVPADRPERFDKAWDSLADAIVVDLEDAVAPERKPQARRLLAQWLDPQRPVWVRCNAIDTPWFEQELALFTQPGVAGVMLPKAEVLPPALRRLAEQGQVRLMPLLETASGFARLDEIAAWPGVVRLVFGSIDFQFDLGIEDDDEALLYFRSRLVLASRLAGLPGPVDGVSTDVQDEARIHAEAQRSRRLGMSGKLCIHPLQILPTHQAYAPDAQQRAWANRVIDAMAQGGAVRVDGKMVDRPVLLKACRLAAQPGADQRLRAGEAGDRAFSQ
jgi:citrate lyase subunit beta/citryl-CoA lyase